MGTPCTASRTSFECSLQSSLSPCRASHNLVQHTRPINVGPSSPRMLIIAIIIATSCYKSGHTHRYWPQCQKEVPECEAVFGSPIVKPAQMPEGNVDREHNWRRKDKCVKKDPGGQLDLCYHGKTLQAKDKCPMCQAAYNFRVAMTGSQW